MSDDGSPYFGWDEMRESASSQALRHQAEDEEQRRRHRIGKVKVLSAMAALYTAILVGLYFLIRWGGDAP